MGTETSKTALNAHVHLRTANQRMSRPERHVDDITDMRRSCRPRENTSGRRPLSSSSRLLKVPTVVYHFVIRAILQSVLLSQLLSFPGVLKRMLLSYFILN